MKAFRVGAVDDATKLFEFDEVDAAFKPSCSCAAGKIFVINPTQMVIDYLSAAVLSVIFNRLDMIERMTRLKVSAQEPRNRRASPAKRRGRTPSDRLLRRQQNGAAKRDQTPADAKLDSPNRGGVGGLEPLPENRTVMFDIPVVFLHRRGLIFG